MKISEISQYIDSFTLVKSNFPEDYFLEGICDRYTLSAQHLFFCSNKTFWNTLVEASSENKLNGLYIIFQKDFLESKTSEAEEVLKASAGWGIVDNVPLALSALSKPFYDKVQANYNDEIDGRKTGTVKIDPTAKIGANVFIGSHVVIESNVTIYPGVNILSGSSIGAGTILFPNVTLMPKTIIGQNCRIHSSTVIGADGFGYNFENGVHKKVWHMGGVVIGDHVEIGSNSCIDQGTFSPTVIGEGSKLDNQVQIGHNVHLGRGVILCGQAAIAGSTVVEDYCVFGGQAGVAPDIFIGAGCQVAGGAGVTGSLESGAIVAGHPARPVKEWLRGNATLRKLSLKK
jgi:UDP-3-O-[3-hydroxymyristoyl] glucosamine N-acyltransferase